MFFKFIGALIVVMGVPVLWLMWVKAKPTRSSMVKIRFDYNGFRSTFYSKGVIITAIAVWVFFLLLGISQSEPAVTVLILGGLSIFYLVCCFRYLADQRTVAEKKKGAYAIPGKIVGMREWTHTYYSRKHGINRTWYGQLIVEYVNPETFQTEEYITEWTVNGNPFYYLKSLDVTVYYKDADHIWVGDFQRIDKWTDNIAYQVTGNVEGKDTGFIRHEKVEDKSK